MILRRDTRVRIGRLRILADDRYRLGGRNVVARIPVLFSGNAVEVLLDNLLSLRELVASAHWEIMADRIA